MFGDHGDKRGMEPKSVSCIYRERKVTEPKISLSDSMETKNGKS